MALALVAVILLPGLAYAALLLSRYSMAERAGYEQDALNVAQSASSLIDRQLLGWKVALQTLATSAHLKSGDLRSFYEQAMLVKPFVNGDIGLREHDGRLVLSTAAPFGTDLPRRGSEILRGGTRPALRHGCVRRRARGPSSCRGGGSGLARR